MDERLDNLVSTLADGATLAGPNLHRAARRAAWIADFSDEQFGKFVEAVSDLPLPLEPAADQLLTTWLIAAVQTRRKRSALQPQPVEESVIEAIEILYERLGGASRARAQLLAWLSSGGTTEDLALFGKLLLNDPPEADDDVVQALAPLFQRQRGQAATLFPHLLHALALPGLAAPVVDLANFLQREKIVEVHPAAEVAPELVSLLGELVQTLLLLEERPEQFGDSPQELSQRVARGVALSVSLCDALALIGEKSAVGKLYQALRVGHRRLRTEAAAALARLGEADGASELAKLAAEPIARLRVLAYAEELGIKDKIEEQY